MTNQYHSSCGKTPEVSMAAKRQTFGKVVGRVLVNVILLACGLFSSQCEAELYPSQSSTKGAGVYVRFKLVEPLETRYHIRLGGFIHKPNWYLPRAVLPSGSDKDKTLRLRSGESTEWFDLKAHCGKLLHSRLNRAGGVAEFPNVTVQLVSEPKVDRVRLLIQLATAADDRAIVRSFDETFNGELTSFLVSPSLRKDAEALETAAQMTARRLRWAREATGGKRISPTHHIVQTSFWGPQRPELNVQEAKVLWLLGFNVVGNQRAEVRAAFEKDLRVPGHTHSVQFGPAATRAKIDELFRQHAAKLKTPLGAGVPYGLADEIAARPPIGENDQALSHFHRWLASRRINPKELDVAKLDDVIPLETPPAFKAAAQVNASAARRIFYYTSRFRQEAATQRIRWHTESFHKHFPQGPITTTLVADHPYFGGTGLGMGFHTPNSTWGNWPLAVDWFDLTRRRAVDMIGIEDWMGLQFMYGPNSTWEGFQLMGFQAAMMRSGGRGETPIISWITPSDETNLRLKSFSSLAQGAKHFFYWTYGPTATSTENYWSDLRGSYDGIFRVTRQLAAAEHLIHPGKLRKTRVALLYSISSDLWQPYDYRHMLERRGTYLSLIHDQYGVDMLTEQDIEAGRLGDYKILYATDPCITAKATGVIRQWVKNGGSLYGSCNAGSRNEFNEPVTGLSSVFGIEAGAEATAQPGRYRFRGQLNRIPHLDRISFADDAQIAKAGFGVIGVKVGIKVDGGDVIGSFNDDSPAAVAHRFGKGRAIAVAATPGISYIKDAKFVAEKLAERWPAEQRAFINQLAVQSGVAPALQLSSPVVEAGVYDAPGGIAVVLANFTYTPIDELEVVLPVRGPIRSVTTASSKKPLAFETEAAPGPLAADGYPNRIRFKLNLGLDEIVLVQ